MAWPLDGHPRVLLARRFPQHDQAFRPTYLSPFHTLHLYDYEARAQIGRRLFDLHPGDVTITPRGTKSAYDMPKPGRHWCIYFEAGPRRRDERIEIPLHVPLGSRREFALQQIGRIANYVPLLEQDSLARAAAAVAMQELLLWVARRAHDERRAPSRARWSHAVDEAAAWISQRLDQPITVPDVARAAGLSQNYLARCFRQRTNMTIPRFILTRRIQQAGYLLETTNLPVKEIGNRVGLPDPQHFNKQFRRLTGQSPTAYRFSRRSA